LAALKSAPSFPRDPHIGGRQSGCWQPIIRAIAVLSTRGPSAAKSTWWKARGALPVRIYRRCTMIAPVVAVTRQTKCSSTGRPAMGTPIFIITLCNGEAGVQFFCRWSPRHSQQRHDNSWSSSVGSFPAPFNHPFYIIMNLAVGVPSRAVPAHPLSPLPPHSPASCRSITSACTRIFLLSSSLELVPLGAVSLVEPPLPSRAVTSSAAPPSLSVACPRPVLYL